MKKLTAATIAVFKKTSGTALISFVIISLLFAGIILNYFIEDKVHASVKAHNKGSALVIQHERYKQVVDKTNFWLSQIDNELSNILLSGTRDQPKQLNTLLENMQQNISVIREEASQYVPKYLVNLYLHKLRNRVDYQSQIFLEFQKKGRPAAMAMLNSSVNRNVYAEFANSETELTAALNKKIEQLNQTLLFDEASTLELDSRWNSISLFLMLCIAIVVLYQTVRINKLNRALEIAIQKMKYATQVKDQFMSNITHELRTPLNSILGYTNLLLKQRHQKETEKWIQAVNSSGIMLLDVVNDVLDYSKLEAGYLQISKDEFQLDEVLNNLKNIMGNRAETKMLSLVVLKDQSLPASFMGDEKKLKQILINLTGNAIKFSDKGTVKIEVLLNKQIEDQYWLEFKVSDTGIGISAQDLQHVFKRFYQVEDRYSKKYSGTGLGLPIVKQLVDMQGGTITAKSEPGTGTEFTFVLPFEKVETASNAAAINLAPVRTMLQLNRREILVVDDHELNRELLVLVLKEYNCNATTAKNGNEALELLKKRKFDMILMDVQMPEMNGLETTQKIRNLLALDTPVIACTAFSQPNEKQACAAAGMNDYLGKPINETELLLLLNKYVNLKIAEPKISAIINFKQIQGITGSNKELTAHMLSRAIEMIPQELDQLQTAILQKNETQVKKIIHTMRSTLGLMGASSNLIYQLQQMESFSIHNASEYERMLHLFYEVNDMVQKMIVELKNYLAA